MERDTPVVENGPIEGASSLQGTQQSLPEENNCSQLEDDCLIARARAVGVDYEFAKPGVISTSFSGKVENMGKFGNNAPDIGQCRVVIIIIIIIIIIITLLL